MGRGVWEAQGFGSEPEPNGSFHIKLFYHMLIYLVWAQVIWCGPCHFSSVAHGSAAGAPGQVQSWRDYPL